MTVVVSASLPAVEEVRTVRRRRRASAAWGRYRRQRIRVGRDPDRAVAAVGSAL